MYLRTLSVLCVAIFALSIALPASKEVPVDETKIVEENVKIKEENKKDPIAVSEVKIENDNKDIVKEENDKEENTIEDVFQERVYYNGSQLWKVVLNDEKDKQKTLFQLRDKKYVSMWGGNHTAIDVLVHQSSLQEVENALKEKKISYQVLIEDIQKAIDEENPPPSEEDEELEQRQGHRMTWQAYHKLEDIHRYLDYLAETYPQLCSVTTIGQSFQGRELKLLKISNGKPGNKGIWIDGGIHAREWISPASVTYIINHLVLNFESEPERLQNLDWYFLPVANPDGYIYSHSNDRLWRKNRARNGVCSGTDLNRNYGYKWGGKGNSRNPCQEVYGGTGPFSEPETAAIKNFITGNRNGNWKASISFHSYGQYILYPWGYERVVPPDHLDLQQVAQKAAAAIREVDGQSYTVGPAANTLYPAAGGSDDWAKGVIGMKYSYTIELRDNGRYGFILPAAYILPTAKEALAATRVIAEAASYA